MVLIFFQLGEPPFLFFQLKFGAFITQVIRIKHSNGYHFVIVDGGMNDFARTSLYDAYHEILPMVKSRKKKITCDIVGPICESTDFFAKKRLITKPETGDYFAVKDTGAYGFSMASTYNMRELPKEVIVKMNGKLELCSDK